jgi:hypothetical protein
MKLEVLGEEQEKERGRGDRPLQFITVLTTACPWSLL